MSTQPANDRVLLFDWTAGGHHTIYLRRFAEVLRGVAEPVIAAPPATIDLLSDMGCELHVLPDSRPELDPEQPTRPQLTRFADRELDHLTASVRATAPGRIVHMYGDPVMRRLVRRPPFPVPVWPIVFFPQAHYQSRLGTRLRPMERLAAEFRDHLVRRWRRRADAGGVLTLDPVAAAGWSGRRGAPAVWLPEPPVGNGAPTERIFDLVVYGALSRHKGLGWIADAIALDGHGLRILLAGSVSPEITEALGPLVDRMRRAGAEVETRFRRHDEGEGLTALASARCAVLAYPRHRGTSRVMLEAAAMRTPVVANDFGLLGHLVRTHGLGVTVDCARPAELAAAIRTAAGLAGTPRMLRAQASFCDAFSPDAFRAAVTTALGIRPPASATSGAVASA